MQTFLPYADFAKSALVLDNKRLGKQRVEALQIIKAISNPDYGWQNHPAVNQWRGYLFALAAYYNAIVAEWISRGFNNTMIYPMDTVDSPPMPPWFGAPRFHISHQSNLIRKDPAHYAPIFGPITADLPYVWPSKENPW